MTDNWPDVLHSLGANAALARLGQGGHPQPDAHGLTEPTSILHSIRSTLTGLMNNGPGFFGRQQLKIARAE